MKNPSAIRILIITALWMIFGLAYAGSVYATAGANIDQCANGAYGVAPPFCATGSGSNDWQNGNLNKTNSNYQLGMSVPFRDVMTGISGAGNTFQIQFQTVNSSKHAYDYLTTFNRTVTGSDPCEGVSGCVLASPSSTFTIPIDPSVTACNLTGNQVPGVFTMWNGTITGLSGYASTGCLTGNTDQAITVTFTVINSANPVVLAWGGHIANETDWGAASDASAISGAPYHMFQDACSFGCGQQDRALQAGAVAQPPSGSSQVSNAARLAGQVVSDTLTLTDPAGKTAPTGSVKFFLCGPTSTPTACITGGTQVGGASLLNAINSSASRATSVNTSPLANGVYCFRTEYTNDGATNFSDSVYTATPGECVTVTSATAVVLSTFKVSPSADGMIEINWTTATEINTAGFNIYRSENKGGPFVRINPQMIPASPNALTGSTYQYEDSTAKSDKTYFYQLEDIELNGRSERHDPTQVAIAGISGITGSMYLALAVGLGAIVLIAGALVLTLKKLNLF